MKSRVATVASLAGTSLFLACGGSSGMAHMTPPGGGTVSGAVVLGPVGGASVSAFAVANGMMGRKVGGGTTDSAGSFSISIGDYAGPLMLQASGGSYADEATGSAMTVQPGDLMACAIPQVAAGAATTGIQITPLTSMAHARVHHMTGGITPTTIAAANAAVGTYFSVSDILRVVPMNPTVAGSGAGATQDQRNYGMAIAAMSRYAQSIAMPQSSGMVTAMMDDASDGVMDGRMGGAAIAMGGGMMGGTMMQAGAGTTGIATAMGDFVASAMNRSGVTMPQMQPLVDQLSGSNGQLPGAGGGTTSGMITGMVVKGAVGGATVTAYAVESGLAGPQVGSAPTDASGSFSVSVGTYAGPVMLQASGGTYLDEATGSTMPMLPGDVMAACLPAVTAGATTSGIQVTPLTSMAQARARNMTGGMTPANMATANAAVGSYFSVSDILQVTPMDPAASGSGAGASQDQRNYGMAIAAMSQYAQGIGMATSSSGMVTTMMEDASDGVMNGMMGSTAISMAGMGGMTGGMMQPTAGTSGLATAMGTFIGSPRNLSGVTAVDMQALMSQLAGSSGQLPGAGGGTTPFGSLSGTVFMGAMTGGTVTAYAVTDGTMGGPLGTSPVDGAGGFHVSLGAYGGPVMLQMAGGPYADEATGSTMTMLAGDVLTSCVASVMAGTDTTGVQVTPLTSMAQARAQGMSGGMTPANVAAANGAVGSYFMVSDILMTPPMDPAVAGSGTGADPSRKNYGMAIAAMSQSAHAMGMTTSSGVVTAMMKDASDGVMNGMMGSSTISMGGMGGMMGGMMQPTTGTSGLATAMTAFVGSAMNRSGVPMADMQPLANKLNASDGTIQ